ncbi:hypothetical protein ACH0CP_12715 [Sphingomonas sp. 179-I 2A4 NHS]|uniref:hypothetical protein n=1 Tax=unclassified Sphingomonas TaxID=196159 RepID=UPI00387A74E9
MPAHTAMVRVYHNGALFNPGQEVDYVGPLDWKYRPTDPAKRQRWDAEYADPDRVAETVHQQRAAGLTDVPHVPRREN